MRTGRPPAIQTNLYDGICKKYSNGISLSALGREFSVSKDTIRLILTKKNIKIRDSNEVNKFWNYNSELLKNLYFNEKLGLKEIADKLKVTYKRVWKAFHKEKWLLRKGGFPVGTHLTEVSKHKISLANKGKKGKPWTDHQRELMLKILTGRKHSLVTKKKMSEIRIKLGLSKGDKNPMKREEAVKKWIKSNSLKPNKQELKIFSVLNDLFPQKYLLNVTGQHLILNGKIPDFVNLNDKKLIEFYGDYWHEGENGQDRIDEFKKYGYDTLIIWEKDFNKNVEGVKKSIDSFHLKEDL